MRATTIASLRHSYLQDENFLWEFLSCSKVRTYDGERYHCPSTGLKCVLSGYVPELQNHEANRTTCARAMCHVDPDTSDCECGVPKKDCHTCRDLSMEHESRSQTSSITFCRIRLTHFWSAFASFLDFACVMPKIFRIGQKSSAICRILWQPTLDDKNMWWANKSVADWHHWMGSNNPIPKYHHF